MGLCELPQIKTALTSTNIRFFFLDLHHKGAFAVIRYLKRERRLAEGEGFFFLTLPAPDWSVSSPVLGEFPKILVRPGTRPTGFACKEKSSKMQFWVKWIHCLTQKFWLRENGKLGWEILNRYFIILSHISEFSTLAVPFQYARVTWFDWGSIGAKLKAFAEL